MRPYSTIQWRAYPALRLAGALTLGIVCASYFPALGFWFWLIVAAACGVLVCIAQALRRRRLVSATPLSWTTALTMLMVAVGGLVQTNWALPQSNDIGFHAVRMEEEITLLGRVLEHPIHNARSTRFDLESQALILDGDSIVVVGTVRVSLLQSRWGPHISFPPLSVGDIVSLRGRLRPPPSRRNPADFDYGNYLKYRDIHATFSVYDATAISLVDSRLTRLESVVLPVQSYIRTQVDRWTYSEDAKTLSLALLLGDRGGLNEEARDQLARTGLMHLLAVSGLHVFLVGMVLYGVLKPFLLRLGARWHIAEGIRASVTIALLLLYMLVSGASPSVVRAVIMASLFIGGMVLQRTSHLLNTLGVAALVLLLISPSHLFEVGFQLSFAAVAAIVTLHPLWFRQIPERWKTSRVLRKTFTMLSVSLAATLGTLPVLLYHFGLASFAGLLLNLLAIPATGLLLAACLLMVLTGAWAPFLAATFGHAVEGLTFGLLWLVEYGDTTFGWATLRLYVRDPWYLVALFTMLVMLAQWPRPRIRWRLAIATLGFAVLGLWTNVLSHKYVSDLQIIFFDVGHGDATLVRFPNGRHLLIDTGARDDFSDQGTRVLLPHLKRYGIHHLDAVAITHPHSDHLGGLPALLRTIPIGRVIDNGQDYASGLYEETYHLLDSLNIPRHKVTTGDTLRLDPSVRIQVLAPFAAPTINDEANNASVVLQLIYGEKRFLFMGDAEAEAEGQLVSQYHSLLQSDVVKVGHHGSRTSSTPTFVSQVLPDTSQQTLALVSVGRRFGLPNEEILTRWQDAGAALWTTVDQHALWLRSDGEQIETVAWN